jgi:hypothetical protein
MAKSTKIPAGLRILRNKGQGPSGQGDAGNTRATALDLGVVGPDANIQYEGGVGGTDKGDVFRFTVPESQVVKIGIQGQQGDVDLYVYNSRGKLIGYSRNSGTEIDAAAGEIGPGTYYARVHPHQGGKLTRYRFAIIGDLGSVKSGGQVSSAFAGPGGLGSLKSSDPAPKMPESLALRDQTGLQAASRASLKTGQDDGRRLAEQMLGTSRS